MSSSLGRYASAFKSGDTHSQFQAWNALTTEIESIQAKLGTSDLQFIDSSASNPLTVPAPVAAAFSVIGVDGKFIVFVNNPQTIQPASVALARALVRAGYNAHTSLIQHHLQSATTLNFDQSSDLKDYGTSPQLMWTDQDPNVTRFFRLRSSYDGKTWNEWQFFSSAAQCGPIGVWSGLLRTAALTQVNAANTPNTQPLTQHLTTTRIDVATTTNTFGSAPNVTYNSGFVDPGSFGTYYIYCLDPQRQGGAVTYLASTSNPQVTNDDAIVFFGKIVTTGGGGGTGSGGGSGPCCVAEVLTPLMDGSELPQSQLRKSMVLRGVDGGPEPIVRIELVPCVPCFRYVGENGLILRGCSSQHSLQYDGGGFDPAFLVVSGHRVETEQGPTRVIREFIGHRTVYRLHLAGRTKTYIADGYYAHNVLK